MRLLVLGGTAWFSREIAARATARGHEVVCAARGESGAAAEGARLVRVDRDEAGALDSLAAERWDSVVDVTRVPSHARSAVAALAGSTSHWLYVSSISVYADHSRPGLDTNSPVLAPAGPELDERDPEHYGQLKRACEIAVIDALPERSVVMRPGLIVGPGDPSGRFSYWPHHAASASDLLVPGTPDDPVQFVDVRDLADWSVTLAERQQTGTLDGTGPAMARERFVQEVLEGVGASPRLVWADESFLRDHDVRMWMGERSIPLWVDHPDYAGLMAWDVSAALAAGLSVRPVAETVADTSAWLRATPDAAVTGLTGAEQAELVSLAASRPSTPS